jgi:hypothetical protein
MVVYTKETDIATDSRELKALEELTTPRGGKFKHPVFLFT